MSTEEDYAPCSGCHKPVKPTGYNFEHVHVMPWDPMYPHECAPRFASPNHFVPRILLDGTPVPKVDSAHD